MADKEYSVAELEEMLYRKKRNQRLERWRRLKERGRVVEVADRPPPETTAPALPRPRVRPTGALAQYALQVDDEEAETRGRTPWRRIQWRLDF